MFTISSASSHSSSYLKSGDPNNKKADKKDIKKNSGTSHVTESAVTALMDIQKHAAYKLQSLVQSRIWLEYSGPAWKQRIVL